MRRDDIQKTASVFGAAELFGPLLDCKIAVWHTLYYSWLLV